MAAAQTPTSNGNIAVGQAQQNAKHSQNGLQRQPGTPAAAGSSSYPSREETAERPGNSTSCATAGGSAYAPFSFQGWQEALPKQPHGSSRSAPHGGQSDTAPQPMSASPLQQDLPAAAAALSAAAQPAAGAAPQPAAAPSPFAFGAPTFASFGDAATPVAFTASDANAQQPQDGASPSQPKPFTFASPSAQPFSPPLGSPKSTTRAGAGRPGSAAVGSPASPAAGFKCDSATDRGPFGSPQKGRLGGMAGGTASTPLRRRTARVRTKCASACWSC